jgi:hypothetical protein
MENVPGFLITRKFRPDSESKLWGRLPRYGWLAGRRPLYPKQDSPLAEPYPARSDGVQQGR